MRRILVAGVAAFTTLTALTACSSSKSPAPLPGTPTATYHLSPRHVRVFETPLKGGTVHDGFLAFTPIGYRTNMPYIVGSHAEFDPQGAFTRIRLVVENTDRSDHDFDYTQQLLVAADGRTYAPDLQATLIERQPTKMTVGAGVRIEFDLLWDIPKNTVVRAVRFKGDPPSPQGVSYPLPQH